MPYVTLLVTIIVSVATVVVAAEPSPRVQRQDGTLLMTVGDVPLLQYRTTLMQPPPELLERVPATARKCGCP